jgi:hypothetical protein
LQINSAQDGPNSGETEKLAIPPTASTKPGGDSTRNPYTLLAKKSQSLSAG